MAKNKIVNEQDIKDIINLYHQDISCAQIGKKFGVTGNTISKLLKNNGILVINKQNIRKIPIEQIVREYCENHLTLMDISRKYNYSVSSISSALKKANIKVINYHNIAKFNENVFDKIDTEEKAY